MRTDPPRCPGAEEQNTAALRREACEGSKPQSQPWVRQSKTLSVLLPPSPSRHPVKGIPFSCNRRIPMPASLLSSVSLLSSPISPLPPQAPQFVTMVRTPDLKGGIWEGGCVHLWIPSRRCLCVRDSRTLPPQAACEAGEQHGSCPQWSPPYPLDPSLTHVHMEPQSVTLAKISNGIQGVKGPQHGGTRGGTDQKWYRALSPKGRGEKKL